MDTHCLVISVAALVLTLASSHAAAAPHVYQVVATKSSFVAHLRKGGAGGGLAHDHVIRAKTIEGSIAFAVEDPTATEIIVSVPSRSLQADDPALRKRYGLSSKLSDGDRRKVTNNFRGPDQLHVAKYRTIRFVSSAVRPLGGQRYRVTGQLTLRGISKAVQFVATVKHGTGVLRASTSFDIKQSDFGYKPYSAMLGLIRVRDAATLHIYLEAIAKEVSNDNNSPHIR